MRSLGTMEVGALVLPIVGVRLHNGAVEVTAERECWERTLLPGGAVINVYDPARNLMATAVNGEKDMWAESRGDQPATLTVVLPIKMIPAVTS